MKRIGMLGGMSWESSIEYYRLVNEAVRDRLGGLHSADCLMVSVDFAEIEAMQAAGAWDEAGRRLAAAAQDVERGGAGCLILCTNTMHKVADAIQAAIGIPFIHIADPTGAAISAAGMTTVGLLATGYTMAQAFYRRRLEDRFGLAVLVPDEAGQQCVHDIIYHELVLGIVRDESREVYRREIDALVSRGAQGIILGCTEIMLLIAPEHSPVPTFDTTTLHALAAVDWALATP